MRLVTSREGGGDAPRCNRIDDECGCTRRDPWMADVPAAVPPEWRDRCGGDARPRKPHEGAAPQQERRRYVSRKPGEEAERERREREQRQPRAHRRCSETARE